MDSKWAMELAGPGLTVLGAAVGYGVLKAKVGNLGELRKLVHTLSKRVEELGTDLVKARGVTESVSSSVDDLWDSRKAQGERIGEMHAGLATVRVETDSLKTSRDKMGERLGALEIKVESAGAVAIAIERERSTRIRPPK